MAYSFTQYQVRAEPPPSALIPIPTFTGWYQPWSEPVRLKPGLKSYLQQFAAQDLDFIPHPEDFLEGWYSPLSDPVRIKVGLRAANQEFFFYEEEFPGDMDIDWWRPLTEPVRLPVGLKAPYQQFLAYHPRLLPNPDVTGTLDATETNADVFLAAINVYNGGSTDTSGGQASVSVVESGPGGDGLSIVES